MYILLIYTLKTFLFCVIFESISLSIHVTLADTQMQLAITPNLGLDHLSNQPPLKPTTSSSSLKYQALSMKIE